MLFRPHRKTRVFSLLVGLFAPTFLLGALCVAQESKKLEKPLTAAQKYKNIKVLKDLPADQLGPLMHKFNDALGVKCDACHVVDANHKGWEKDDKKMKETARDMIRLTNDLNRRQKALKGKATCFLCHHGKPEPQNQPAGAAP
jgi:hypothetical protein